MLLRLGRWLRAAGYDTSFAGTGEPDEEILARARKEGRLLVTRDKHFLGLGDDIIYLNNNGMEECAKQLGLRLDLDWLKAPFSRCLVCNAPLVEASQGERDSVHDNVEGKLLSCPDCNRTFWDGSHTRRMREQLEAWQSER